MTMSDYEFHRAVRNQSTQSSQWQRWKPAPIHEPVAPQPPQATEPAAHPTPDAKTLRARIKQAEKDAMAAGYQKGLDTGYQEGLKQGQEDGYKQGFEQGLKQGHEAGRTEGSQEAQAVVEQLDHLLQSTGQALADLEAEMGQAMVTLAVRIAEKVVYDTITTRPDTLLTLIQTIINLETEPQQALTLHLNPADLPLVEQHASSDPKKQRWRTLADDTITRGGCRISTPLGDIDATLETRWKRIVFTLGEA